MRAILLALASLVALTLLPICAQADVGLVMRCDGISAATQAAACTGSRAWVRPGPGDAVLSYPTAAPDSNAISWNDAGLQFRPWVSIPGSYGVLTCTKDIAAGAIPAGAADPCAPGADAVAKVFVSASAVVIATVPVPTSSPPPVATGTGSAKLTWIPPTQNTDGSALTDLAGFYVYMGTGTTPLAKLSASTLSYTVAGLAPGTYVFAVTAVNSAGLESAQATAGPTSITKQTIPGSPSQIAVTVTVSVP